MEYRLRRADGVYRWVLNRGVPLKTAAGHLVSYIGSAIDITLHKEAEQILQQSQAELERRVAERTVALHREMVERHRLEREAQRAEHFALLGRLAAGVSHEIRNPLAAISLHVDLLEEDVREPSPSSMADMAELIAEIKTELARMSNLVQDYLSLVRAGHIQREVQDLGVAVQAWGVEFQTETVPRGVTLRLESVETLGPIAFHANTLRVPSSTWCKMPPTPCPMGA